MVGSLELSCLRDGGMVFGDRVDEAGKSLFEPLEATVDELVHVVFRDRIAAVNKRSTRENMFAKRSKEAARRLVGIEKACGR